MTRDEQRDPDRNTGDTPRETRAPAQPPGTDPVDEQRAGGRREPTDRRQSSLMERLNDAMHRLRPGRPDQD